MKVSSGRVSFQRRCVTRHASTPLCQSQAERVCTPQNRATVTVRPRLSQADCDCVCPSASICPDSGQLYGKLFSWFSRLFPCLSYLTRSAAVELGALGNGVLFHAVTCEQPPIGYVRVSIVIWFWGRLPHVVKRIYPSRSTEEELEQAEQAKQAK